MEDNQKQPEGNRYVPMHRMGCLDSEVDQTSPFTPCQTLAGFLESTNEDVEYSLFFQ
jgi:hypothetical protein